MFLYFKLFFSARVRWSPLVRAELLKTPDNKLPCQIMIVAVGAAAAGNYFSSRVRWSPLVRTELLKTPDNKLPCQTIHGKVTFTHDELV